MHVCRNAQPDESAMSMEECALISLSSSLDDVNLADVDDGETDLVLERLVPRFRDMQRAYQLSGFLWLWAQDCNVQHLAVMKMKRSLSNLVPKGQKLVQQNGNPEPRAFNRAASFATRVLLWHG